MNKRISLYVIALLLSLMFICVVAFNQEPTYQENKHSMRRVPINDIHEEMCLIATIKYEEAHKKVKENVETESTYKEYQIAKNSGFKSYMPYQAITDEESKQYKLQAQYACTGEYGIRQVDGRFCIAIGTFSNAAIGTYVDLVLENEVVIPCVIGDFKADVDTDENNIVTVDNGCVAEFVVEKEKLPYAVHNDDNTGSGDISSCTERWDSPVKYMRVYEKNVFKEGDF